MIGSASTTATTTAGARRRRRPSSITLTAVAAIGLAMCASVADGFAPLVAAPVRAAATAARSHTPMSTSTTALAAVGVEPEARSNEEKPRLKFGNCEDSWDCEGTQSCCDYILFRMCCTDGTAVQEQWVPVPIPVRPNDGYPGPYSGRAAHR